MNTKMKDVILKIISSGSDISSNRTIGLIAFLFMMLVMIAGLLIPNIGIEKLGLILQYLLYIVLVMFGFKGLEKILGK